MLLLIWVEEEEAGRAYNFENVGNDLVGRDMAIILEQISLWFVYVVEGWLIPSRSLVSSAMFEDLG